MNAKAAVQRIESALVNRLQHSVALNGNWYSIGDDRCLNFNISRIFANGANASIGPSYSKLT